ncbi:MFS transporter [Nonomuraea sp. NPDC047897]|uniref:MFS transporter n=1 Tax=Nonomuraea sp. NPDC047897 TaxID=3364346 RepID=UPI003720DCC3
MPITHAKQGWPRATIVVVAICFTTVIFDGYDLIVYGAVIPLLLQEPGWSMSPAAAGAIGGYALIGMLIGALVAGTITDIIGRRPTILLCLTWFSLATGACAMAGSKEWLGALRFLAGLGLGGVIPTATALTLEYAPAQRRNFTYALMFSGWAVGGVLTAVVGQALLPEAGWRVMFLIGALPIVIVLPLAVGLLPESLEFLRARGRHAEASQVARRFGLPEEPTSPARPPAKRTPVRMLFVTERRVMTSLLWAGCFLGLLLVYGLNTWLPQIMRQAGFSLGSALNFLLALNAGTILGALVMAKLADRRGPKQALVTMFAIASVSILLLSTEQPMAIGLVLVAGAGFGVGTQILLNAYIGNCYPAAGRATALGWSLGFGRLGAILGPVVGGWLVAAESDWRINFYFYAAIAVAAGLIIVLVPRTPAVAEEESGVGQSES